MRSKPCRDGKKPTVLFFGRRECRSTETLLRKMTNFDFEVTYIESKMRGERLPAEAFEWAGDYILCYRSLFFVPKIILDRAKIAAVNFHPAPPEYPGSGCINFALYDESDIYGVTAHLMNEKIDNGKILEVRRFPVHKTDDLPSLLERTHSELYNLCADFICNLSMQGVSYLQDKVEQPDQPIWSGEARKMEELERLSKINIDTQKGELDKVIRATCIKKFPPTIHLHGYEFILNIETKDR